MTKFGAAELAEVFGQTLRALSRIFDDQGQPWMLIGGLAVGAWTEPRATKDCDFAIALPPDVAPLVEALRAAGLVAARGDFAQVAVEGGVVRLRVEGPTKPALIVDLLCAGTEFERVALGHRRKLEVLGVPLYAAAPDDLLVYKLIAGRPQDLADIDRLIRFGRAPEDEQYVRAWARQWDVEARLYAALAAAAR
jgi:hypothetical protein